MASQFFPGGATGANANLNTSFEPLGWNLSSGNPDGTLTAVACNPTGNLYTSTAVMLGTTVNAWEGFYLFFGQAGTNRYMVDIFVNGSAIVTDYYIEPSTTVFQPPVYIPIPVPAGAVISAKSKSNSTSQTIHMAIDGVIKTANSPPGFSTMVNLNPDSAATRAGNADIAVELPASAATWATLVAGTAAAYGALMIVVAGNGTSLTDAQAVAVSLGVGAALSEVELARLAVWLAASSNPAVHMTCPVIPKSVPLGSRLAARVLGLATGAADVVRIGVYGLA